jgi:hypothetical protein
VFSPDLDTMKTPEKGGTLYFYTTVLEFDDFTVDCRPTHPEIRVTMIEVIFFNSKTRF